MKQVLEPRKVTLIFTVLLFLLIFSLVGTIDACFAGGDGGIGDPTDPLNPESPPPGGGGDSLSNNLLILYGAMDLIL
jgi:hypothetical protein